MLLEKWSWYDKNKAPKLLELTLPKSGRAWNCGEVTVPSYNRKWRQRIKFPASWISEDKCEVHSMDSQRVPVVLSGNQINNTPCIRLFSLLIWLLSLSYPYFSWSPLIRITRTKVLFLVLSFVESWTKVECNTYLFAYKPCPVGHQIVVCIEKEDALYVLLFHGFVSTRKKL